MDWNKCGFIYSSRRRKWILLALVEGENDSKGLMQELSMSYASISSVLRELLKEELVSCRRMGRTLRYSLTKEGKRMAKWFKKHELIT